MKHWTIVSGFALGLLALTGAARPAAEPERAAPRVVVGVFDSRALAVAWIRSEEASAYLGAQKEDLGRMLERARELGDLALARELERLGPDMQQRMHEQGFGSAPVDDLLARVEDRLPGLAEELGVDLLVSRWQLAYRAPEAELVDVTDAMAELFHPNEETRKTIRELVTHDPVPLDELQHDH